MKQLLVFLCGLSLYQVANKIKARLGIHSKLEHQSSVRRKRRNQLIQVYRMRGIAMFRKHGRTVIRCPMLLKHKTLGVFEAVTRDISSSGMFMVGSSVELGSPPQIAIGDELFAEVESTGGNGADDKERLQLKVARIADDGFALTFV